MIVISNATWSSTTDSPHQGTIILPQLGYGLVYVADNTKYGCHHSNLTRGVANCKRTTRSFSTTIADILANSIGINGRYPDKLAIIHEPLEMTVPTLGHK